MEPSSGMREQFARVLPGVRVLDGTGESIPLPDTSADALVCAQARHWVDPKRAVPEVARVLRPGGKPALVWNVRDVSVPWVVELDQILHDQAAAPAEDRQVEYVGEPFEPVEQRSFSWSHPMTTAEITDMVASRSYVITPDPAGRYALLGRVRALLDTHRPTVTPYVTTGYRAQLSQGRFVRITVLTG